MDLVSYVEFQSSFSQLLGYHRSALRANRSFWRLLARPRAALARPMPAALTPAPRRSGETQVNPEISFRALSAAFEAMDSTEAQADRTYRTVLERYPKSAKLLRAYAGFLEEVRNNPWAARKYLEDADKVEAAMAEAGDEEGMLTVNDKTDAVVVISSVGTITVANKNLASDRANPPGGQAVARRPAPVALGTERQAAAPEPLRGARSR